MNLEPQEVSSQIAMMIRAGAVKLIEPYAGLGAYSLRAMGLEAQRADGRSYRLEPPVSRVGNKAGFVLAVLKAWGLDRARWSHVWLNDLDPVCHLIHLLYASSELRDEVARRIWAMVPCPECNPEAIRAALDGEMRPTPDELRGRPGCLHCGGTGTMAARLLWERIRNEPVPGDVGEALAHGLTLQGGCWRNLPVTISENRWRMMREVVPGTVVYDESRLRPADIATNLEQIPCGLASLAEVTARGLFLQSRSFQLKPVSIVGGAWEERGYKPEVDDYARKNDPEHVSMDSPRWTVAERLESLPGPGGVSLRITRQDAALCLPEGDCSDCVVVLDPPYEGTTGYQATSCRADVLMLARAWDEAGALVILHEACGLASEVGDGWHEYPAGVLRGRRSTFHAGGVEREWITTNRRPVVGLQAPEPIGQRSMMVQGELF